MLLQSLIAAPLVGGLLAFVVRNGRTRRGLLLVSAALHLSLAVLAWAGRPGPEWGGWLALDALGLLVLLVTSVLFLAASVYAVGYLAREREGERKDFVEGWIFSNAPEAVFIGCLHFFLASMTLVAVTQQFGLLWVGIEATTLASAPLIYFHRHKRSLEAVWKYLMVCSVGIALALLGYLLLAGAASFSRGGSVTMTLPWLLERAALLEGPWLKGAFIFFLVGYGTKMGLAPLHTWLPDAHSESPSVVSALLSGALLNCAFLGILRPFQVLEAAGEGAFGRELLVVLGLLSMSFAAVYILGQTDYKRLLAYSSVEHMGILALGVGVGGVAAGGSLFHLMGHSFTKGMLFLTASNFLAAYRTKEISQVSGGATRIPVTAALWAAGFFAITGTPPFSTFLSEFLILQGALGAGRTAVAVLYLFLLAAVFAGMAAAFFRMIQGRLAVDEREAEPALSVFPPLALGVLVLLLGVALPSPLRALLEEASLLLGGSF